MTEKQHSIFSKHVATCLVIKEVASHRFYSSAMKHIATKSTF